MSLILRGSVLGVVFCVIGWSQTADAAIIAADDFSYADGSLVPNGGWANHSGTPGDLQVIGGQALVQHGTPSEDANLSFADQTTGNLTASFDIVVNDDAPIGGTDFEYFAHFFAEGSFNFSSRLDVVAPTGAGDYTLGISSTTSTAEATLASDFSFGDTVSVLLGFDLDTGIGSLTVGAETVNGTSSSLGETFNRFALRQSDSSGNESILVDNLVINGVSAIPEPGSAFALSLLAGIAVFRRRK